jgi:sulfite reductase (NADPH) flavoprotein alpha-component
MSAVPETPSASAAAYSRSKPFWAEVVSHERLTGPNSSKDTRHFVLNLHGSGLSYVPGDSLGVFGCNSPSLVQELIRLTGFDSESPIRDTTGGFTVLREALTRDFIINRANRKIMAALEVRIPQGEQRNRLAALISDSEAISQYIETRDFVDVFRDFPEARFETPQDLLAQLTPVTPRLYSIASSLALHPDEVHLCVAIVRYDTHGRPKKGLTSGFLADHADAFLKSVPVYVQPSRTFRLPRNPDTDIIMVGPGTGIAPFRAFVEQRVAEGAKGRNWLFFGEQHQASDFLYGEEWLRYREKGRLHHLDLAFSRDQEHKIYVQHRMQERAKELWEWLQRGAYLYVCGDARRMAKDVHETLIGIAKEQGSLSPEAAADYVNVTLMKTEKRYLRDVY